MLVGYGYIEREKKNELGGRRREITYSGQTEIVTNATALALG